MAVNSNPRAIALVEQELRPTAGNILNLYFQLKQQLAQSQVQQWGAAFPGDGGHQDDTIADGTTQPPTNYQMNAIISVTSDFIAFMEANSNQNLNLLLASKKVG